MYNQVTVYDNTKSLATLNNNASYLFVANRRFTPISDEYRVGQLVSQKVGHVFLYDFLTINVKESINAKSKIEAICCKYVKSATSENPKNLDLTHDMNTVTEMYISKNQKVNLENTFAHVDKIITNSSDRYKLLNDFTTITVKESDINIDPSKMFSALSINVANKTTINTNPAIGAGGDLKELIITVQMQSFFEFNLDFKDKVITGVIGLPAGVQFNSKLNKLVGSPQLAGVYPIQVVFDDCTVLPGRINVPKIKRDL